VDLVDDREEREDRPLRRFTLALATVSKDPRGEVGKDDDKRAAAQLWDACSIKDGNSEVLQ